ncbi:Protein FAM173B [Anabarilius grahami]|uniref:Protein FAM173B n=1 Tax=Anabarilius grahami TaxID=495550 RepID=A0A3N0YRE7_ANAGA|nr:Protein FAM173B [Anabarilius grahami]
MEDSIEVILEQRSWFSRHCSHNVTLLMGSAFAGVYGLWAAFCMPGLRVPFRLKVPFLPSTKEQTANVIKLLDGHKGRLADLGSGLMGVLEEKLLKELPEDARVIVCRFPFPHWPHSCTAGSGLNQVWAYDVHTARESSRTSPHQRQA